MTASGEQAGSLVRSELIGAVAVITLNRPEAGNSLSPQLFEELGTALGAALEDATVRCLVLTGAGDRFFCTGMDLSAAAAFVGKGQPGGAVVKDFLDGVFAKPLIAAVNGAAVGGGFELVLACDLVVAAEHARFGLPEVKLGLVAGGGGTLLASVIPRAFALELALTGKLIDAARANQMGLLNRVVAGPDVLPTALELGAAVSANGPLSLALTKRLVRDVRQPETEEARKIFTSADAKEGAAAFLEKRSPQFQGR